MAAPLAPNSSSLLEFRTPAHRLFDIQQGAAPARDLRYRVSLCEQPPTQHQQSAKQQGQRDAREHPGKVVIVLRISFGSVEISHLSSGWPVFDCLSEVYDNTKAQT